MTSPLLRRSGSFEWLRHANDAQSRQERRQTARETQDATQRGWYMHVESQVALPAAVGMCTGVASGVSAGADEAETQTRILSPRNGSWPSLPSKPPELRTSVFRSTEPTVLDTAVILARKGLRTAVVNAASAYHVGGGFSSGGRHALEEAICIQSTLFCSLQRAHRSSGALAGSAYIPADGAVLSPRVEVFRQGTSDGYKTLPAPVELTCVVSIAMPNLNHCVRDAPTDKFSNSIEYRTALFARWRAALHAACTVGATDLVCPDAGCGVYCNDPTITGECLGTVLRAEYWGHIQNLWLVGGSAFCEAAIAAVEKPVRISATATANGSNGAGASLPVVDLASDDETTPVKPRAAGGMSSNLNVRTKLLSPAKPASPLIASSTSSREEKRKNSAEGNGDSAGANWGKRLRKTVANQRGQMPIAYFLRKPAGCNA